MSAESDDFRFPIADCRMNQSAIGGRQSAILHTLVIATTFLAMAIWTWGKWADTIGNGRELYIPWRIAHGEVLYRDLPHHAGPFSQYFNGLLFWTVGTSARTLVLSNLAWLAALVVVVHLLWTYVADRIAATVACVVLLLVFSFVQLTLSAGFNFVLPYAHELTHGVILSFGAIACLTMSLRSTDTSRARLWLGAAGGLVGLVFLTRAEPFVAVALPVVLGALAGMYARRTTTRDALVESGILIGMMLLPAVIAVSLLRLAMPTGDAIASVLGSWRWSFDQRLLGMDYYALVTGAGRPSENLSRSLKPAVWYVLALLPAVAAGLGLRQHTSEHAKAWHEARLPVAIALALLVLAASYVLNDALEWMWVARGLNVAMLAVCLTFTFGAIGHQRERLDARVITRLCLAWFALLLLARMGLRVAIHEFGFAIAMPAMLVAVAAVVGWIPAWVDRTGGFGWAPRAAAITALAILCVHWLGPFARNLSSSDVKPIVLGEGADALRFDRRATAMRDMLAMLDERAGDGDTLFVLPEGALVNYYAAMRNPTGYVYLMPPDMLMFGHENVLAALRRSPPDWVVMIKSNPSAYGFEGFAKDYGREIWSWVGEHYTEVATTGDSRFWMKLYGRKG